ncbi:MAG: hypothetical protein ACI8TP_001441 [Acidimicrobiales bacterium]
MTEAPGEIVEFEGIDARLTPGRFILGVVVLASFVVWIYAYSGRADRDAPDTLDDSSYATAAEPICAAAVADIERLPNALDAVDEADRANQIRILNVRYLAMVEALDALPAESERDRGIVDLWLDRWRVILGDRESYADRLESDPEALFYLSADAGRRAERSLSYIADTNLMPSCGAPGDLG